MNVIYRSCQLRRLNTALVSMLILTIVAPPDIGAGPTPLSITVEATVTAHNSPLLTGNISEITATIQVEVNGNTYAAENEGNGTWTVKSNVISPPLADGTYEVIATATGSGTATDQTNLELTVDASYRIINPIGPVQIVKDSTTVIIDLTGRYNDPFREFARLNTVLGNIDIELFEAETPATVANFLSYVNNDDYVNSFIHRLARNFVLQGGGFIFNDFSDPAPEAEDYRPIVTRDPIKNEPGISNIRGTVAMAKMAGNPDTASSQWFISLADNSANLNFQNGGFTVFGEVTGNGMTIADAVNALPVANATILHPNLTDLPLIDFVNDAFPDENDLVMVFSVDHFADATLLVINGRPDLLAASINGNNLEMNPEPGKTGIGILTVQSTSLDGLRTGDDSFLVAIGNTTSAISGRVWSDVDGDGVLDPGEAGLPKTKIFLDVNLNGTLDDGELVSISADDDTLTPSIDESGTYIFSNLPPGNYRVREEVPGNFILTLPDGNFHAVTVGLGELVASIDFGNYAAPGKITGRVQIDSDGDGNLEINDPGLAGVRIFLDTIVDNDTFDTGEPTTISLVNDPNTADDETGNYVFSNIFPGMYDVREFPPMGFTQTFPAGNGGHDATVPAAGLNSGNDFGNDGPSSSIVGLAWEDTDGNTGQNGAEPGITGITIFIHADDGVGNFEEGKDQLLGSAVTAGGNYTFPHLAADDYWIRFDPLAVGRLGFKLRSGSNSVPVSLGVAATGNADFGFEALTPVTETLNPEAGWNIISLPVEPVDSNIDSVLSVPDGGGRRILREGPVWRWIRDGGGARFEKVTTIHALTGYYVYIPTPEPINVMGYPTITSTIELGEGWNLIGPEKITSVQGLGMIQGGIWSWDGKRFADNDSMNVKQGYWIWTGQDTFLDVGK